MFISPTKDKDKNTWNNCWFNQIVDTSYTHEKYESRHMFQMPKKGSTYTATALSVICIQRYNFKGPV